MKMNDTMKNTPTDHDTIKAMQLYGGSFAKALSFAALKADSENLKKIKATWPEMFQTYEMMARRTPSHFVTAWMP